VNPSGIPKAPALIVFVLTVVSLMGYPVEPLKTDYLNFQEVSHSSTQTCAIMDDGSVWCWDVEVLELLQGYEARIGWPDYPREVEIPSGRAAVEIESDYTHSCAIVDDGSIYCWTSEYYPLMGEIYLGGGGVCEEIRVWKEEPTESTNGVREWTGLSPCHSPVRVSLPIESHAVDISIGFGHSCAVIDNGSIYCWGDNEYGQLGDGTCSATYTEMGCTGENSKVPVQVGLPSGLTAVSVSAGGQHTCAIVNDGSTYCWGNRGHGSWWNETPLLVPVKVNFPGGIAAIDLDSGFRHSCATLIDRTVYCWGAATYGQLGNEQAYLNVDVQDTTGSSLGVSTPVRFEFPSDRKAIGLAMDFWQSCVITARFDGDIALDLDHSNSPENPIYCSGESQQLLDINDPASTINTHGTIWNKIRFGTPEPVLENRFVDFPISFSGGSGSGCQISNYAPTSAQLHYLVDGADFETYLDCWGIGIGGAVEIGFDSDQGEIYYSQLTRDHYYYGDNPDNHTPPEFYPIIALFSVALVSSIAAAYAQPLTFLVGKILRARNGGR
jgi:hypothetical protein